MLNDILHNFWHFWPQFAFLGYVIAGVVTAFHYMEAEKAAMILLESLLMLAVLYFGGFWDVLLKGIN